MTLLYLPQEWYSLIIDSPIELISDSNHWEEIKNWQLLTWEGGWNIYSPPTFIRFSQWPRDCPNTKYTSERTTNTPFCPYSNSWSPTTPYHCKTLYIPPIVCSLSLSLSLSVHQIMSSVHFSRWEDEPPSPNIPTSSTTMHQSLHNSINWYISYIEIYQTSPSS